MAETPSTMLPLGTELPEFSLRNAVDGRRVTPADYRGSVALVVMFICNHCPFVKHVLQEIGRLTREYQPKGVAFVAINSNDVAAYPDDNPEHMQELAEAEDWIFPFLYDGTQEVAKAFRAACTPDFFVFDKGLTLVYRGQLDGSRPGNGIPVTGRDLRTALDALVAGTAVSKEQRPSVGCNIKWMPGNEPDYFAR
jgi:thiol-disulfide isomerase/thioredoxin